MTWQMNKRFKEMSLQIADTAQDASNAYDMATNYTLEIGKVPNSISGVKIELADLQYCSSRNNDQRTVIANWNNNLTIKLMS